VLALDKRAGRLAGKPDIVSRGFVDAENDGRVIEQGKELVISTLGKGHPLDYSSIHARVKETLSRFFFEQTRRRPMIITTAIEV
jgi:ribonuclease J